jgi:hypothetical protein
MPKYELHYQNQTFELYLYDDFYVAIDDERLEKNHDLGFDVESILNTMMEKYNNAPLEIKQWMEDFDHHYTVTKDGIEICPSTVQDDMIDEDYKQAMLDEGK